MNPTERVLPLDHKSSGCRWSLDAENALLSSNMAGKSHISSFSIFDYPRVRNVSYTKILCQMGPLLWNVLYSALHPLLNIGSMGRRLNKVQGCPMVPLRLATSMDLSENKHLVGGWSTIRKNMSSSMGRMTSHIWKGKIIQMFETTNQFLLFIIFPCFPAIHAINWRHWNPIRHQFLDLLFRGFQKIKNLHFIDSPVMVDFLLGK